MKEYLLVGNPNTGKTTFFNYLTKSNEKVGNWHGVTVEEKKKNFDKDKLLVDLPGIYSLTPLSFEEEVAVKYIYEHKECTVLNICDVNNLARNLYLTLELMSAGINTILILNTMGQKQKIDIVTLKNKLGIEIILFDNKNKNKKEIIEKIIKNKNKTIKNIDFSHKNNEKINLYLKNNKININFPNNYILQKVYEKDDFFIKFFDLEKHKQNLYSMCDDFSIEDISKYRYDIIENVLNITNKSTLGKSKLDKFFLNKYFSIPIFFVIMFVVFYLTFFLIGPALSNLLKYLIEDVLGRYISFLIRYLTNIEWIIKLFEVAIIGGLGTLLCFLPQIAMLFMFLYILEDSGYMARIAFIFEDIFYKLGLSGKSIYTMIMGFGCSTSAIITSRNMEDKNAKIKTALITPYMSCSAKLPIYAVIGGAFFGKSNIFIIFGLYVLGIIVGLFLSFIFEKKILKSKKQSFILEFPRYKAPNIKKLLQVIWENIKLFLIKVGSLLICMNIIVWIFQNFTFSFSYVGTSGKQSILQTVGEFIAPLFKPLGFGNYGAVSSLIAGFVAKEIIVSSIAMFNGINIEKDLYNQTSNSILLETSVVCFTPFSAISYMIYCLLYSPCLASVSMLKEEIGTKWTLFAIGTQLIVAYTISLITYQSLNLINKIGVLFMIYLIVFSIIGYSVVRFFKFFKNKKCTSCLNCNKCRNK